MVEGTSVQFRKKNLGDRDGRTTTEGHSGFSQEILLLDILLVSKTNFTSERSKQCPIEAVTKIRIALSRVAKLILLKVILFH